MNTNLTTLFVLTSQIFLSPNFIKTFNFPSVKCGFMSLFLPKDAIVGFSSPFCGKGRPNLLVPKRDTSLVEVIFSVEIPQNYQHLTFESSLITSKKVGPIWWPLSYLGQIRDVPWYFMEMQSPPQRNEDFSLDGIRPSAYATTSRFGKKGLNEAPEKWSRSTGSLRPFRKPYVLVLNVFDINLVGEWSHPHWFGFANLWWLGKK